MHTEIKITLKNEESRYTQKFSCYESYTMSDTDPIIKSMIEQAEQACRFSPDEIKITATLQVR